MRGKAKPGVDWTRARELFELGDMTLDEIGSAVGCTRFAVIKRRDKEGWRRPVESPQGPASIPPIAALPALSDSEFVPLGTKDSPEVRGAILRALSEGATLENAAIAGGVHPETLKNWRDASSDFSSQCTRAVQHWHRKRLGNISQAGDRGDWKADAWLLERHPATRELYKTAQTAGGPSFSIVLNVNRGEQSGISAGDRLTIEGKAEAA